MRPNRLYGNVRQIQWLLSELLGLKMHMFQTVPFAGNMPFCRTFVDTEDDRSDAAVLERRFDSPVN